MGKKHHLGQQTIRRRAWELRAISSNTYSEARELCGANPGERCWAWTAYKTRQDHRDRNCQIYSIVHRCIGFKSEADTFYSLFCDGLYIASADTYAETAYTMARKIYDLEEGFLVPSEILSSFEVAYNNNLPFYLGGEHYWIDAWNWPESKLTKSGLKGMYTSLGSFLESSQDSDPIGEPPPIAKPDTKRIILGNGDSTLEAGSAACGMDDKQAAEVVAYLTEPVQDFAGLSRKEKRRLRRAQRRSTPHFLLGVPEIEPGWESSSRSGGSIVPVDYDVYDVPRYKKPKPTPHPTPLGKRVEGRRFIECPENWEDCSDMNFRDIMAWRCSRKDESEDRLPDEECIFELEVG